MSSSGRARRGLRLLLGALLAAGTAGAVGAAAATGATSLVGSAGVTASTGDADHGKQIYARCAACHSLTVNRTGPMHCGLLGRRAGDVSGFAYSEAMKRSGIVWTTATLDRFLANPMQAIPGTAMGYAGVSDPKERADVVAFLAQASGSPICGS
jgi:cytochrome c